MNRTVHTLLAQQSADCGACRPMPSEAAQSALKQPWPGPTPASMRSASAPAPHGPRRDRLQ